MHKACQKSVALHGTRLQWVHSFHCKFRALNRFVPLTLCALLTLVAGGLHAEKADRDKPLNIEADKLVHDDARQISIFSGKVVATKGTIILRGDRFEVRQDPQGNQFGLVLPEAGQRAFFRQKREGLNEFMEGEAERIEYDGKSDRVTLAGRAVLRRFRAATLNDELSGQLIVYDNVSDRFTVDSNPAGPTSKGDSERASTPASSRVRAWLTPAPSSSPAGGASK
jgi:lipopolysaccharide export system protein LptA